MSEPPEALEQAIHDAVVFGTGVMVMQYDQRQGVVIRHVPVDDYLELADALRWTKQQKDEGKLI